jgi:uncharacterized protein (TIGR00730 family)
MAVVTVFAGSNLNPPKGYRRAALELGERLARAGYVVRTGAGRSPSLMGLVVDGALSAGGRVEGVILDRFMSLLHPDLKPRVTNRMYERKKALVKGARALIVLPGGFGTLDELFEVLVLHQIQVFRGRIVAVNLGGYFDAVRAFLARARREGFVRVEDLARVRFVGSAAEAVRALR